jgi:hypothetical protein
MPWDLRRYKLRTGSTDIIIVRMVFLKTLDVEADHANGQLTLKKL